MTPSAEDLRCSNCGSTRRVRGHDGDLTCADCGTEMVDRGHGWRPSAGDQAPTGSGSTSSGDLADDLDVPAKVTAQAAGLIRAAADAGLPASVDDDAWVAAALIEASDDVTVEEAAGKAGVDPAAVEANLRQLRSALE